jgi:hypothetical protein
LGEESLTGSSRQLGILIFSSDYGELLRDGLEADQPLNPTPSQRHMPSLDALATSCSGEIQALSLANSVSTPFARDLSPRSAIFTGSDGLRVP